MRNGAPCLRKTPETAPTETTASCLRQLPRLGRPAGTETPAMDDLSSLLEPDAMTCSLPTNQYSRRRREGGRRGLRAVRHAAIYGTALQRHAGYPETAIGLDTRFEVAETTAVVRDDETEAFLPPTAGCADAPSAPHLPRRPTSESGAAGDDNRDLNTTRTDNDARKRTREKPQTATARGLCKRKSRNQDSETEEPNHQA